MNESQERWLPSQAVAALVASAKVLLIRASELDPEGTTYRVARIQEVQERPSLVFPDEYYESDNEVSEMPLPDWLQ